MAERRTGGKGSTKLTASVVGGLIMVPLSAIAAVAIVGATSGSPSQAAPDEVTTTSYATTTTLGTVTVEQVRSMDEDHITEACTTDAATLVDLEQSDAITELQTAALDALREICAAHDMAIAGPPGGGTVVKVVTVPAATTTTLDDSSDDSTADDQYEGEYADGGEDDDHEDHGEDHGEDHEDEDHEDHGHVEDDD
jgi:mRNA-degrading endonuclease toxin of MazEF toxin-antitoxin module